MKTTSATPMETKCFEIEERLQTLLQIVRCVRMDPDKGDTAALDQLEGQCRHTQYEGLAIHIRVEDLFAMAEEARNG